MLNTRVVKDVIGTVDLCETFSDAGYKLLQVETGIVYGCSVIDIIDGFIGNKPYSRFNYSETDEKDDDQ